MNKHTPGPWAFVAADDISSEHRYISSHWVSGPFTDESQYRTICDIAKWDTQERQIANAQLIAAAPDLLEALEAVLECGSTTDQWWMDKAKAAINKAEGRS